MTKKELNNWALAIAIRVSDEWSTSDEFNEDVRLLKKVLYKSLLARPVELQKLIGTGVIEADYFETLS